MAIFVQLSMTRKRLTTTIGVAQILAVFMIFTIVHWNMQTVEIFSEDYEWRPVVKYDHISIQKTNQSATRVIPTVPATDQSVHSPMLTLFTTFTEGLNHERIHNNTLANWAALKPHISPVLFIDAQTHNAEMWTKQATFLGWQVRNITKKNKGVPILKHMYTEILREHETPFYGFATADILFDQSLVDDIKLHRSYLEVYENHGGLLLIGKRTEMKLHKFHHLDPVDFKAVSGIGRHNGTLSKSYKEDYLITTRTALPWENTPDLVVGQAGYGSWLVVKAQICNVTVIDASYTLLALHQAQKSGESYHNWDYQRCINKKLVGKSSYDCSKGVTECAPYVSHKNVNGTLKLYKRPERPSKCKFDYDDEQCKDDLDRYDLDDSTSLF